LEIKILDYNNEVVVKKIIKEWNDKKKKEKNNKETIELLYNSLNLLIYKEYNLNNNEIQIVEKNQK